jgi:hypothetical protein
VDANNRYGLIDTAGTIVVKYQYDEIVKVTSPTSSSKEFFKVKQDDKYGVINQEGELVIRPEYDGIYLRSNESNWVLTKLNDKYGFAVFDWRNSSYDVKEIFKPIYDEVVYCADDGYPSGYVMVRLDKKWGLVNEGTGQEITGMKYDKVDDFHFHDGFGATQVTINGKHGLIDKKGNEIIPCKYDKINIVQGKRLKYYAIGVTLEGREFYLDY